MLSSSFLPVLVAAVLSLSQWASAAYPQTLPCSASPDPAFVISDWTGSYNSDSESFTFLLETTFSDYYSGCHGTIDPGETNSGLLWCSTVIPGYNVSFTKTDNNLELNHAYKCTLDVAADGTAPEVAATAHGSASLNIVNKDKGDGTGTTSLQGGNQTMVALTKTL
ncbi:hypothetical protein F5X99DRAFT_394969 [Biscogniauxia marginata]|nr:hypothetical protein F5X99DRAFT_394969 [Biscogniauxia marginata]